MFPPLEGELYHNLGTRIEFFPCYQRGSVEQERLFDCLVTTIFFDMLLPSFESGESSGVLYVLSPLPLGIETIDALCRRYTLEESDPEPHQGHSGFWKWMDANYPKTWGHLRTTKFLGIDNDDLILSIE